MAQEEYSIHAAFGLLPCSPDIGLPTPELIMSAACLGLRASCNPTAVLQGVF